MGPKKPKKSKEELEAERLAKEEEDRKAAEIEKKRLAAEAEKARIEAERVAAFNLATRISEMDVLGAEYVSFSDLCDTRSVALKAEEEMIAAKVEWENFRNPTGAYDVLNDKDVNAFIAEFVISTLTE